MDKKVKALDRRVAKNSIKYMGKAEKSARKESNKRKHQDNLARRERRLEAQAILRENLDKDPVDISQRFSSSGVTGSQQGKEETADGHLASSGGLAVGLQSMADVVARKRAKEEREALAAAAEQERANLKAAEEEKQKILEDARKEEQARARKKKKARMAQQAAAKLSFAAEEED
eukprot:m.87038 g.87038  ORF g.87038 m.87038 type:complete len:175 (-) comp16384_c1_seq1:28-552(-)